MASKAKPHWVWDKWQRELINYKGSITVRCGRQVGKSTFLMKHWREKHNAEYLTFDKQEVAIRATRSAEQFLLSESVNRNKALILDEAHKVPHIFDSIKALVNGFKEGMLAKVS